ncbi:hypothetical protein RF11_05180 [Thelohanellus kitauei]|uniref:Uncharacterized protein n=1 Tax=Thelohanellus kitauei TaxID=669202 RepID=A0A0C2IXP6_THEKT|nr:hypothetical protein RF11_05180 [Thelohanellus kitauei]
MYQPVALFCGLLIFQISVKSESTEEIVKLQPTYKLETPEETRLVVEYYDKHDLKLCSDAPHHHADRSTIDNLRFWMSYRMRHEYRSIEEDLVRMFEKREIPADARFKLRYEVVSAVVDTTFCDFDEYSNFLKTFDVEKFINANFNGSDKYVKNYIPVTCELKGLWDEYTAAVDAIRSIITPNLEKSYRKISEFIKTISANHIKSAASNDFILIRENEVDSYMLAWTENSFLTLYLLCRVKKSMNAGKFFDLITPLMTVKRHLI